MAKAADIKAPQPLSKGFDVDDDGWLDRLVADEDESERATLWRLGTWAIAAVVALTLGLMSGQVPDGAQRTKIAEAELASQAKRIEGLALETKQETRRIAAAVETLNADRDRLFGRITAVEQGLDSVTGSIAKQAVTAKQADLGAEKPAERSIGPASAADAVTPQLPAQSAPAQVAAPAATEPPKDVSKDAPKDGSKDTPKDTPKAAAKEASKAASAQTAATPAAAAENIGKKADRSDSPRAAPPPAANPETVATNPALPTQAATAQGADPAATTTVPKPEPGQQVASTPSTVITAAPLNPLPEDAVAAATEADVPVERTQFGLDIGGASSMAGLRALWSGVRKSHPSQFAALRPVLAIRQNHNGLGLQVRVIAGPIPDAAAAAQLCAILTADARECETAIFDGQRLLPDIDNTKKKPAAASKPSRRKPAEATSTTQPKQPADGRSSSLSSLLGVH
jgi:hypothetical protein